MRNKLPRLYAAVICAALILSSAAGAVSASAQQQQHGGARAQDEDKGELRLYHRATQIGTTANRTFKDARGRVVKVIYYTGGGGFEGPYSEELLREQSIETYDYDEQNCRTKSARYAPGMKLLYTTEVICGIGTDTPALSKTIDAGGVTTSITIHKEDGGSGTSLFLGDDGDRLVAIDGKKPKSIDLVDGWGEAVSGFQVGIAAGREKGRQGVMRVWVTIRNVAHDAEGVVMVAPLEIELRDAEGRLVKTKPEWATEQPGPLPGQCPALGRTGQGAPFVGESDHLRAYELGEYFNALSPGKYSFKVKHCLSTTHLPLVSNTIHIEIQ